MNTSEDEPSSGLNGRLRPRKSYVSSPQNQKVTRKSEGQQQDKAKKLTTPTKTPPNKPDDLANKSDFSPTPQFLCPYCDRKFASKQTVSKHARRMHFSSSKQDSFITCLFCNVSEANFNQIIRHMVEQHSDLYFACLHCHSRFSSISELAEHKLNVCEKQKPSYRSKLRQKGSSGIKKNKKATNVEKVDKEIQDSQRFNGVVISCELKPSQVQDGADIEDNITTNLILPPSKSLGNNSALEKNAVIVLDDIQWNKRIPPNFSFHNSDADQILSRLGVVHRSPRTAESNRRDWLRALDDSTQKFEKCFDTSFYSKVASNVQENLSKFLDGSFNFNPDPDNTIKTRKSKNSVVINAAEGFPILLASEQYSRNLFDGYMPRAIAPKHKWKWDNIENDKNILNPDQIKRDSHTNNCIITLVSRLDIWTQLSMRRKFQEKFNSVPLEKKTEKRNNLSKELKEILESREIPTTSSPVVKQIPNPMPNSSEYDFPSLLGLTPSVPNHDPAPAVLSGEWVRPRCYVCCACGAQTRDSRALSEHVSEQHPNAQVQHYEIVGERLLNSDIMKHLYVPPSQMCNRTRPPRGFRDCTKCSKSITLEDLHQHMLDCAGDTPTVRRRQCRYRPFGVRKRRPRLPDNTIRKKMRNDIRSRQKRQKSHIRPRPKIRTEVGDAETIRKMIADLPAKRHRVMVNPINQNPRPRRNMNQLRNKLIMKKRPSEDSTNRKKTLTRHASNQRSKQGETSSNVDKSNNLSSKEDDEDNKPLKATMKRVINKRTRQNEFVQRKSVMSKAKRKLTHVKTRGQKIEQLVNSAEGSSSSEIKKSTSDEFPEKIDVKGAAYNTREHANRGGSNNRDVQRPGCSRPNGNSNNGNPPTQNAPLKHSIARLTANSETHDKSVQFSHSFLVQQECNNTNQHVPSGQQTLFENEAAITRLDKPPLNLSPKGSADYCALQKSKLNKPRKKLNDCIAMLKNKLVDPVPSASTSQVSVQCGTDDPMELEPLSTPQEPPECADAEISFSPIIPQNKSTQNSPVETDCLDNVTMHKPAQISQTHKSIQNEIIPPQQDTRPIEVDTSKKQKQKGGSRKKSSRVADSRSELVHRKTKKAQSDIEIISPKCNLTTSTTPKSCKKSSQDDSNLPPPIIDMQGDLHKEQLKQLPKKSDSVPVQPIPPESKTTWEKPLDKLTTFNNSLREHNESEMYDSTCVSKEQKQASAYSEYKEIPRKQTEIHAEHQPLPKETSDDGFSENVFSSFSDCDLQLAIPPAHASTHVESIVMTPLDLSGKIQNFSNPNNVTSRENLYCTHDCYETLDLSNKSEDRLRHGTVEMSDVVVDLSVKPIQSECEPRTLDLCTKSKNISATEELMKTAEFDNVPTDLSIKGKDHGSSLDLPGERTEDINYVQDLSANKDKFSQIEHPLLSTGVDEFPTDLSGKSTIEEPSAQINETNFKQPMSSTEDVKLNYNSVATELQMKSTRQLRPFKQPPAYKINQEKTVKSLHPRINDKSSAQVQKPVYDPTLKIPQYKIRAASSTTVTTTSGTSETATQFDPELQSHLQGSSTNEDGTEIPVPERLPYDFEKASFNTIISTKAGTVPVYTLPSRPLTSTVSKYESTTPVYTLANACISVTKIEPASSATLTNTLLSIPMTTIANTASVYTLAGTTIGAPISYGVVPNTGSNIPFTEKNHFTSTSKQILFDPDEAKSERLDVGSKQEKKNVQAIGLEQDAEIARKIAMLPKELVDILGNMPVDHRNQLLNILPQYVSTTSSTSVSQIETVQTITNTTALDLHKSSSHFSGAKKVFVENNTVTTSEPHTDCRSNIISTSPTVQQGSKACQSSIQLSGQFDSNEKHSTPIPTHSPTTPPVNFKIDTDDIKTSPVRTSLSSNLESNTDDEKSQKELPPCSATNRSLKINEYDKMEDRVIDLTCDELVPLNADTVKVVEDLSRSVNLPVQEIANFATVGKTSKQKGNNDQTASLRAVRIKAPSERQKENKLLKTAPIEKHSKTKENNEDDNEANKLSESNKYLAIQQAEISSTQHGNKNVVIEPKCTLKMPPTAPNAEGSTIKTRRLSRLADDIVTKKENSSQNVDVYIENPITKTVLVTSSISASQLSRKESTDKQSNEKTVRDDLSNTFDSTIHEIPASGNQFIEASIIKNSDDVRIVEIVECNAPVAEVTLKKSSVVKSDKIDAPLIATKDPKDNNIHEEDSDDDVSLAVIVKQKQQQIVTHPDRDICNKVAQDSKLPLISKKRKKAKKVKNNILKENTLPEPMPNITGSVRPIDELKVEEENIVTSDSISEEQSKKSSKISSNINVKETIKLQKPKKREKCVIDTNSEKVKYDSDVDMGSSRNRKEIKTTKSNEKNNQISGITEVIDAPISCNAAEVIRPIPSENLDSSEDFHSVLETSDTKESVNKKPKVKTTKKKRHEGKPAVDSKESKATSLHGNDKITVEKSILEQDYKEKNTAGIHEAISNIDETIECLKTPINDSREENTNAGLDTKKSKKSTRTKKSSETDFLNCTAISDMSMRHSEENTSTPLRRSRRGKSLYVDDLSSGPENIVNSESFTDNKAPFTKKQLIFSKLLLDEENITNSVCTSDIENSNLEKSIDTSNADKSSFDEAIPHISYDNYANELAHDKIKPGKRKKSPHLKQKHKKKKSLDSSQSTEINTIIDNAQNDSNLLLKESHECNSPVLDSSTSVKENIEEPDLLQGEKLAEQVGKVERNQVDDIVFNGLDNRLSPNASIDGTVGESDSLTKVTSSEKRKILRTTINAECGSKPKKSKLMKNKEIPIIGKYEDMEIRTDELKTNDCKKEDTIVEHRNTACYSVPVAARRTRSKSVVVKSSVENFYDPYDIDLDDMLDHNEPLRKKRSSAKETKKNYKQKSSNLSKADDNDIENNVLPTDLVDIEMSKKSKRNKTESLTLNCDKNKFTKSDIETIKKIDSDMVCTTPDEKTKSTTTVVTCEDVQDGTTESLKDDSIDSDDSSKSDVPLKKYVEEKEKKIAELSKSLERENEVNDTSKSLDKKLTGPSHETSKVDRVPDETQEQLRSEQFMESFGFFSERKPRKSNLLATKKISETFHIIANESDDMYFGVKDRHPKRQNESRKSVEGEGSSTQCTSKKTVKRGRKKKSCIEATTCYCGICKKEYRRPDNYLRHQMSLFHVSKLSEIEMKVKTVPFEEEPNYLIVYKQHLDRLKVLTDKLAKQKKTSKPKIVLPPMTDILAEVSRAVRQQQLLRRGLSRDEALFLDCCELLKESHKTDGLPVGSAALEANVCTCPVCPARTTSAGLDLLEKLINEDRDDTKSDGDVDSITAKNILESEEVRNLENDLISGLQEAANTHKQNNLNYHQTMAKMNVDAADAGVDSFSSPNATESHYDNLDEFDVSEPPNVKTKDKMYPDITEIDLFEDKFDKIKRKCRSQAAAAKQSQTIVESSHKGRKKSEKKKGKKSSKKNYQNTVLTKGALKGFDGIKVSIPTSDINMPAIVQPLDITQKKKKKSSSKKKREKRFSESNSTYETDNRAKDGSFTQKKVDVYEFMDNEDAELFEFRPSTLMERFKSISNKDVPSTSRFDSAADEAEASSESASDGDDFVYMSDDYMCSDDETENSLLSCELGNLKVESKKCSLKRKDVVEKNAVMGKIFKNAVRTEKKSVKAKEPVNPKANLDQLFDSLLEEEPSSSMLNDLESPVKDDLDDSCLDTSTSQYKSLSRKSNDHTSPNNEITTFVSPEKCKSASCFVSPKRKSASPKNRVSSPSKLDTAASKKSNDDYLLDYGPSTSKKQENLLPTIYGPSTSKKYDDEMLQATRGSSSKKRDKLSSKKYDGSVSDYDDRSPSRSNDLLIETRDQPVKDKTASSKYEQLNNDNTDFNQEMIMSDAGVARQRARRKCTVGKQNVLAETWSSESEPDGALPRSNSSESIVCGVPRKKKGRKKDGQQSGGRRGKHVAFKKQDIESRVTSSNRNTSSVSVGASRDGEVVLKHKETSDVTKDCPATPPPEAPAAQAVSGPGGVAGAGAGAGPAGAPGAKGRSRSVAYYWSSEGDDEQEHLQQHGWIVGDSHKKLVTMLAHAKGRKRNSDDKRHLVE